VKALVTGAGGFLGLYIVEELVARGDEVRALCRGSYSALDALGVETIRGDVRDRRKTIEACRGVDVVFHVAAKSGIGGPWMHYYSVSAPYPTRWLAHYPHSKALAERHVLGASGTGGLLTCALRPHLIWGPRDQALIPRLLERARSGRLRRVGDGANLVDMIYVESAARAHLQAADALEPGAAVAGRAYFLSQGEPINCWGWINQILALAGLAPVRKSISLRTAWRVGAALELAFAAFRLKGEPPMTRFLAAQLATSHYFNITAARKDFGYQPAVSTAEGMRRLGQWLTETAVV